MLKETNQDEQEVSEALRQILARQEINRQLFEKGVADSFIADDIGLGNDYKEKTEIRMSDKFWLVLHKPTVLIDKWQVHTGPRELKTKVERWVDLIDANVPPVSQEILDNIKL